MSSFALTFVTIIHVLLCVFMVFVILLQPGKEAGMGAALGGGASSSAFGGRGAVTFLSKVTGVCAALFFLTSLALSFEGLKVSVADQFQAPAVQQTAPAAGGTDAVESAPVDPTPAAPTEAAEEAPTQVPAEE